MNAGVQNLVISLGAMQRMFSFVFTRSTSQQISRNFSRPKNSLRGPGCPYLRSHRLCCCSTHRSRNLLLRVDDRAFSVSWFRAPALTLRFRSRGRTTKRCSNMVCQFVFCFTVNSSASYSRASFSNGSFTRAHISNATPQLLILQAPDQQGELITTTVRDYDLSETSKLVRLHPSVLLSPY
jgi:hypothetical protein